MSGWWDKALKKLFRRNGEAVSQGAQRPTAPQQPEQQPVRDVRQSASPPLRRATIGLDFGTSSTKCCFREERDGKPYTLLAHNTSLRRANRLLFPTSAALAQGRLIFGYDAEAADTNCTVRSFKTCLQCQARAERPRLAQSTPFVRCARCPATRPGYFRLADREISAEDLATLYLSVVLREAKARVLDSLNTDPTRVRINVNSAAPLDQMSEFGELEEYFRRAVFYAWQLADQGQNGWVLSDALAALESARRIPLPETHKSPTRVFPETHAAMTAYLLHPESENGLYGLVDVGAGTTDVAFFWLQKDDSETKAWYYAAGSTRVGMDDVDAALSGILRNAHGHLRAAREGLSDHVIEAHRHLIDPVSRQMYQYQAKVLDAAMQIDQRDRAWRSRGKAHYRLFLVGGGSSFIPVKEAISQCPFAAATWDDSPAQLCLPPSTKVSLPDGHLVPLEKMKEATASTLLLLAYGLAYPRPDIPRYERDKEGVKSTSAGHDTDLMVPDGHWWSER